MSNNKEQNTGKFSFPHPYVLLFSIIVLVGILTYVVPAGQYERMQRDGVEVVKPGSFQYIEQSPVKIFDFFTAIPKGIHDAAFLIIMILLIGGAIQLFDGTGAIRRAILALRDVIGDER
ncbi:MAG: C4-dicarboxylate ABC transporter permease, partial [Halanaerobiales bacterium]